MSRLVVVRIALAIAIGAILTYGVGTDKRLGAQVDRKREAQVKKAIRD